MAITLTPDPHDLPEFADDDVVDGLSGENNVVEPIPADKQFGWHPFRKRPARNIMNWLHRFSFRNLNWMKNTFFGEVQAGFTLLENSAPDISDILSRVVFDVPQGMHPFPNSSSANTYITIGISSTISERVPTTSDGGMLIDTISNGMQLVTLNKNAIGSVGTAPIGKRIFDRSTGNIATSPIAWAPGENAGSLAVDVGFSPIVIQNEFSFVWLVAYVDGSDLKYDWVIGPHNDTTNISVQRAVENVGGFVYNGKRLAGVVKIIDESNPFYTLETMFIDTNAGLRTPFYRFENEKLFSNSATPLVDSVPITYNQDVSGFPIMHPASGGFIIGRSVLVRLSISLHAHNTNAVSSLTIQGDSPVGVSQVYKGTNTKTINLIGLGATQTLEFELWTTLTNGQLTFTVTAFGSLAGTIVNNIFLKCVGWYLDTNTFETND